MKIRVSRIVQKHQDNVGAFVRLGASDGSKHETD
jgi:hypothetical protein